MDRSVRVTAYECKTRQAEIFRRAAAGDTIIVTHRDVPYVEIRKASADDQSVADAIQALAALQRMQLAVGAGRGQEELRRIQEQGRD